MSKEDQWIDWIRGASSAPKGWMGIGDDGALLPAGKQGVYVMVQDAIVADVDFDKKLSAQNIGRKALAVNLSDLAAMGASPQGYFVTLGLPERTKKRYVQELYRGMFKLAKPYKMACLGGDMSRSKHIWLSVTAVGCAKRKEVVTRSGAKVGDLIAVTGSLGGSLKSHHYQFKPRVEEGVFLAKGGWANAMMDLSDGLHLDLGRLLRASGKGGVIDLSTLPPSKACVKSPSKHRMKKMLSDGEDFELLFTVPAKKKAHLGRAWKKHFPRTALSWVGKVQAKGSGFNYVSGQDNVSMTSLQLKGFNHFK